MSNKHNYCRIFDQENIDDVQQVRGKEMKIRHIIALFLLFVVFVTGCSAQAVEKPEQMAKLLDEAVRITDKAVYDKDIKLAREIWNQVSEYGVKAAETDHKELADSLGKLASTYVHLVSYIETGDELQLRIFRGCFDKAVIQLREYVAAQKDLKADKQ